LRDRIDVEDPGEAAKRIVTSPGALAVLAQDDRAQMLLRAAELKRRAAGLEEVRRVAEDPEASEHQLQDVLLDNIWIFGGRYVSTLSQRRLTDGKELDIPLLRADGVLQVVELKLAMKAGPVIKKHRNTLVPAALVHNAVAQAHDYLVALDEDRNRIRAEFGIETRRASATVLVGHPGIHPEHTEAEINDVLRTLNSYTSRVEVLTYKDLVDSAERTLTGTFDNPA